MSVRRFLTAALLAPVVLLLAACGGDDTSVADPPISSSPTSSAPTQQRESPEHFVRRWFDIGTQMQNSGDVATYLAMQSHCRGCEAIAHRVRLAYASGGYYRTAGVRTLQVTNAQSVKRKRVITVRVDLAPTEFKVSRDSHEQRFHGGPSTFQLTLMPSADNWLVTQIVQVAS